MYFWNQFPFIRLSIALIAGIILYDEFPDGWVYARLMVVVLLCLYAISVWVSTRTGYYRLRHVHGVFALLILFLIGGLLVEDKYAHLSPAHYLHHEGIEGFSGRIVSDAHEKGNHLRYDFELQLGVKKDTIVPLEGLIHLYIEKDSTASIPYRYGDLLTVGGRYYEVPGPSNPHGFDYSAHLAIKGIHSHAFVSMQAVRRTGYRPSNPLFRAAFHIRGQAIRIIDRHIKAPQQNSIAKALLLGVKNHLDNELKKSYASVGAMHVLAVSGLHVGIIYLLLQLLLGGLKRYPYGKIIFGILSIGIIWMYAMVTGLSPSVLRAATMFTFITWSQIRVKEGNIYNTLGLAAFVLLLTDPYLIYSVGFQLSFGAVFGIVYFQPKIYRLFFFNNRLVDKIWAITCVSMAAQLTTFPISIYYFHQFPTYFLLSNLVVIPAASVILMSGIALFALDPISFVAAAWAGKFLSGFIWLVNQSIFWIEELPYSLVQRIVIDRWELMCIYAMMIGVAWGLHHKSFKTLVVSGVLFVVFTGMLFKTSVSRRSGKEQLILYAIKNKTIMDHISGDQAILYVDQYDTTEQDLLTYQVSPNRLQNRLPPIDGTLQPFGESTLFQQHGIFQYGMISGKKLLIIDSTAFHLHFTDTVHTHLLLIENESVKNMEWLCKHFQFDRLVIGNKNSYFYSEKMRKQSAELGLNFHSLRTDGALVVEL